MHSRSALISASSRSSGREIVKCNIGEPDFPVPAFIKEEVKRQIDLDNTHYCDPQGIPSPPGGHREADFRDAGDPAEAGAGRRLPGGQAPDRPLPADLLRSRGRGGLPEPRFPDLRILHPLRRRHAGPLHPARRRTDFPSPASRLASVLTERTKLIFLNFPSNPTGGVASPEQLQEIAAVIRRRCSDDVRIYSDEIYEHILFDGHAPPQHRLLSGHGARHDHRERRLQELCLDRRPDRLGPLPHAGGGGGLQEPQHQLLLLHRRLQPGGGAPGAGIPRGRRSRSERWWRSSRCAGTWSWTASTRSRGSAA
ncbi:MAG: aminotransferase class I/II-fold pyridoxal phosphate-dependent enzyme [Desulfobacterales bacterium]|nr:aminotransferase class I/II-fold pyridoxal phosphate-dependent enzyme [Desulfobacterales bacterium]